MSTTTAVDPDGCGCTDCLTGRSVPLNQATPEQIAALVSGRLRDRTETPLTINAAVIVEAAGHRWNLPGSTWPDLPAARAAIREEVQEEEYRRRLEQPSLRHCIIPGCLREFDAIAAMSGRRPERPSWSGTGWRIVKNSAVHAGSGHVCPGHAALFKEHFPHRTAAPALSRVDVRCGCGTWVLSGQRWHGAARGLWEEHILTTTGAIQ